MCDLVELRVISAGTVEGFKLYESVGAVITFPRIMVKKNDFFVVHFADGNATCNLRSLDPREG
jgi:hypothetical protein